MSVHSESGYSNGWASLPEVPASANLDLRRSDLLAVALPPSDRWLEVVADAWAAGAAILPIDHRLPPTDTEALISRARPTAILDVEGLHRLDGVGAEDGVALVIHTSGTGGFPKLVQFERHAIEAAVAASALALEATPHDRWLSCLPLAHVGGLLVLLRGVLLGAPVTVHERFDVDAFAAVRDAVMASIVPTMLIRLLDADVDLARYRTILVGGAHLEPDLRERAIDANVVETYGLTESCGGVVYDGQPLPGVEVRLDADGGIELRGPTLMLGYRFDPEATRVAFTDDGWLRPGDVGELDDEGRLRVLGRVDDLINSGGEKVWPTEVETALGSHPKVGDVAVAGREDREWGQRVVAWVVPRDPSDPPTLQDLRDHVSTNLARHKAPRELVLVPRIPRTPGGKLRRRELVAAPVGTE
jgi:O-succinylbenzoic acid--CoA ligase